MNLDLQAVSFKADQKLQSFIAQRVEKLDHFFDRIVRTHVMLRLENSGQIREKIVEMSVHVPGEILFTKTGSNTFEGATEEALNAIRKQLERYKNRKK